MAGFRKVWPVEWCEACEAEYATFACPGCNMTKGERRWSAMSASERAAYCQARRANEVA